MAVKGVMIGVGAYMAAGVAGKSREQATVTFRRVTLRVAIAGLGGLRCFGSGRRPLVAGDRRV
jgi:hypothetical protein